MSAHTCHADGCPVVVPRKMFMCRRHWYMLPKVMRNEVLAAYTPGQESDWGKVTERYLDVTLACINFIAQRGAPLPHGEPS